MAVGVVALWFAVATVTIVQFTGSPPVAGEGEPGMLQVRSELTAAITGAAFPFFSGFIGAFIAGSNTVSDILFDLFRFEAAQWVGALTQIIADVQAVGGAIGNRIPINDVVAAPAVVGLVRRAA